MSQQKYHLRILSEPEEFSAVEALQRLVWPGNETEVVPAHLLIAAVKHGGLCIGAFITTDKESEQIVGFVFGLPGIYHTPDGPRLMHYSHMLGVHPDHRSEGLGFLLKRAQWQMVRKQGVDRITWTYDPLLSRNAHLNIAKLGAVCNTYHIDYYGVLRDGLNVGMPTDRFEVDWWVHSQRVNRRLSRQARQQLDLAHYLAAGAEIINPSGLRADGLPYPRPIRFPFDIQDSSLKAEDYPGLLLVEIPSDYLQIKVLDPNLALEWRLHSRQIFPVLFQHGYFVTDFIYLRGNPARSLYVLSHGDHTL
ncbi:MAG: GNAT family N-acetyltransferase [Anaerolineales bacterium]|nr:GNAT family N-acetyltransferase [Anaerolineales bacterium]